MITRMSGAEFHLQSLALTMVFVSGAAFFCLAPAIYRFPAEFRSSLRSWIVGTALVTFTDVVFFTETDIPFLFLDTTLMAIAGIGVTEWLHALRLLNGKARRLKWPYAVVVVGTTISALSPSYPMSSMTISVAFGVLYFGAAWAAMEIRLEGPSVGRKVLITVFSAIGVVMFSRVAMFLMVSGSGASLGFTTLPRALMFIAASAGPFAGSLGFVLTCGEKLGHQLFHLSMTDSLTGVPNRRAFLETLERSLASGARHARAVAVMVVDVDHFKRVNDEAGHLVGDQALIKVAQRLADAVRAEDMVGRIGGEEFGVIQIGADLEAASAAAERLRLSIAETPVTVDDRAFSLTVSVGVAVTEEPDEEPEELLARADRLLYSAKAAGRNRIAAESVS
jgi:diguanylate cyclase (GGDEF)-like protein